MQIDNRPSDQPSSAPQTGAAPARDGYLCCNPSDTSKVLLKIGRVIIFISCIVLTVVAITTAAFVVPKSSHSIYSILECVYLLVIVTIGFYATLYHSKQALILFSLACSINSVLLVVSLVVKAEKSLYAYRAAYRSIQYLQQCTDPSYCAKGESCCQAAQGTGNYFNVIIGDDPTLYALLWCLAIYHIILTILSGMIAGCTKPAHPSPGQQARQQKTGSKSPAMKYVPSQVSELRVESDVSSVKQMLPRLPKESKVETTRSNYRTQPVILISQPGRQGMSHIGGARVSPPQSPVPESSIDQIKNATTRVE